MNLKTEGLSLIEQVEIVQKDMEQLLDGLVGTDSDVIDFEQLEEFACFSERYSKDIRNFILNSKVFN